MAEETLKASEPSTEVAVAPAPEKTEEAPAPTETVTVTETVTETVVEKDEEEKIGESASFKEESNVAGELPDPQKKALDELKCLVQEALNKHEFTKPVEEKKPIEEKKPAEEEKKPVEEEKKPAEEEKPVVVDEKPAATESSEKAVETPAVECKEEEKTIVPETTPAGEVPAPVVEAPATEKVEKAETCVEEEKKIEVTEEKIIPVTEESPAAVEESPATVVEPEEVSIWGIPLLADERSDVVLLKFLRARDFKVKEAFAMLKSVVAWRKEFDIEALLSEDLGCEQEKVVYMHGTDKEGHPVCYNAYGEYQNKELYNETFSSEEKRTKFLRWRIQFLEKSIRKLDFSPDGVCTIVQVVDFKNSPGPFKWELRQATNQAFQLFQDNYPEFVAKQVFINVPFLYLAFYKIVNPFFTQRTKSKFVFAGPSKTAETLFKYIAPELVPVQYGGLSREGEQEFTASVSVTEDIIKPATKHCIDFPVTETCTLVWEARVVGYEITYGAEFVPSDEAGYTVIVQKARKISATTDEPILCGSFKCSEPGKVVLTFDNQTSKKKKILYRSKTKTTTD
nr:hypothetical protein [Tanacetum cinerariifolium]